MSIYPVKLIEWFPHPKKRRDGDYKSTMSHHEDAKMIVKLSKCLVCGKQPKWNRAIGHHSIPWGYGDIWCSEKCMSSGKRFNKALRQKKPRGKKNKIMASIYDK